MSQSIAVPDAPTRPRAAPRWLPDVLVTVVVAAMAFLPPPIPEFTPNGPWTLALVLSPIAIVPWRRRWPFTVLVLLVIIFGAAAALGTVSPGVAVAIGVAMFQVALRSSRRRGLLIGACAALAVMLLTLLTFLTSVGSVLDPRVLQFGLLVAFAAAAGDGARSRHAYIAAITERAERAMQTREAEASRRVSEERLRIARDLHDAVAHQIAVISLNAGVATSAIESRPEKAKESLQTIRTAARTVLGEIGDLLAMLRAADSTDQGPRPQAGVEQLDELVAQFAASGLEVHTRIEGDLGRAPGAVGLVAYRVIQESLTNAHKHGAEHRAHVLVHVGTDEVTVTVTNPAGPGTVPGIHSGIGPGAEPGAGLGLIGLRERVALVRGAVSAGPAPAGWKVEARLPLPPAPAPVHVPVRVPPEAKP